MKKIMFALIAGLLLVTLTGCKTGLTGIPSLKETIVGNNYASAGEIIGESSFYAYELLKADPKYAKYAQKMEEVYAKIEKGETTSEGVGVINEVALLISEQALAAKYGTVEAVLITRGIRIGGAIADRIISGKVDKAEADEFFKGFLQGVAKAKGEWVEPVSEIKDEVFSCPNGECEYTKLRSKDTVEFQLKLAKKLKDEYADKNEKLEGDKLVTDYDNLLHFIERMEQLDAKGYKTTKVVIDEFKISGKKLKKIVFLSCILQPWHEIDCVGCEYYDFDVEEEAEK